MSRKPKQMHAMKLITDTMKKVFTVRYLYDRGFSFMPRNRVAYLLRAARSRRSGNILRTTPHLYRVLDCSMVIEAQS